MNKLNLKLLLILILFLFACSGSNDEISEIKKPLESSGDEKGKQSDDNRQSSQPSTLIDFNPQGYNRNCMIESLGPQKTYEIYESNKIDPGLMYQIGVCELSGDDKKSTGKQSDDNRQSSLSSTLIDFNPQGYNRNCMIDNLGSEKAYEIYESNKIDPELMNQIGGCELSEDEKKSMGRQASTLIDFNPDEYSRNCMTENLGPQKAYEVYESNKIDSALMNQIGVCKLSGDEKKSTGKQSDTSQSSQPSTLVDFNPDGYDRNCITDTLGPDKTYEIYQSNKLESDVEYKIENCKISGLNNRGDPSKETIKQLIQRLYIPKTLVTSKVLEPNNQSCTVIKDNKKLHNTMNFDWQSIPINSGEVADFIVSPTDPSVVYLGIQENTHSVYKSIDGGKNWNRLHNFDHTKTLNIHPTNPDIFLYGDSQQIWRTENGEDFTKSFQSKYSAGPADTSWSSIAFFPKDPSIVIASIKGRYPRGDSGGGEIYVSKDGGKSFKEINVKLPVTTVLLFDQTDSNKIFIGTEEGVLLSEDFFKSSDNILSVTGVTSLNTLDGKKLIATSIDGIHISEDGGNNWITGKGLDKTVFLRAYEIPQNRNIIWATTSKGIAISRDAGYNWELNHPDEIPINVKALAVFPDNPDKVLVSTDSFRWDVRLNQLFVQGLLKNQGIYMTYDSGKSWEKSNDGLHLHDLETILSSPVNPDELWTGQQAARGMYKSTDAGKNWELFANYLSHYPMKILYFPGYSNSMVATSSMYYSVMGFSYDSGNTWTMLSAKTFLDLVMRGIHSTKQTFTKLIVDKARDDDSPKGSIHLHGLAVNPKNIDEIFVGSVSDPSVFTDVALRGVHLFKSKDGGETWITIGEGLPFTSNSSIRDIQISPSEPNIIYLGLSEKEAVDGNGIWKSIDGGDNWKRASNGMPDSNSVQALYIHPDNSDLVVAGTNYGIFITTDGGLNWIKKLNYTILDLSALITEPNIVYASGRDGAWVSTDLGNTWVSILNDSVHNNKPKGNVAEAYYSGFQSGRMKMYISAIEANCNGSKVYIGISGYGLLQAKN